MINKDQFRKTLYETLLEVKSGKLSVSKAQRKISRLAVRLEKSQEDNQTNESSLPVSCPICGETEYCIHRDN